MDLTPRSPSDGDLPATPLPDRYAIRADDDGTRYLACREAPTVRVLIEEGAVSASTARGAPPGTIFLDGAAQGAPFLDTERGVHNLDHHEECVRAFTLAACEQALVLVLKGFDLRGREWDVRANEPDLDTVLAIWVLLNHMRLGPSSAARSRVIPLVRLEGVIDAHGLELQELCGFPEDHHRRVLADLERLRAREMELTRRTMDRLQRAATLLREVDALIYDAEDLHQEHVEVEELARAELTTGGLVVACRSPESIYRVEQSLRWLYGDRLAVVVLEKDGGAVTLRQVAPFLPASLDAAYAELNLIDPAAGPRGSDARWGGSAEIGGSPRGRETGLTPREIARACARAYCGPTVRERLSAWGRGLGAAVVGLAAARGAGGLVSPEAAPATPALAAALALALLAAAGLGLVRSDRRPGLFGLRMPAGHRWWLALPAALAGAVAGGGAIPAEVFAGPVVWTPVLAVILLPVGAELLFRGLVQPLLSRAFRRRNGRSSWIPRPEAVLSALLYAGFPWALGPLVWAPALDTPVRLVVTTCGALLVGLACAVARHRAESLLAPLAIHLLAVGAWVVTVLVL